MASLGHTSRRPPPAKPHPTLNGSARTSPASVAGSPTMTPTMRTGIRAGDEPGEEWARQGEVGRVVAEQQPGDDADGQGHAQSHGERQPLGPVAPFGEEDPPEQAEADQHRRQHRHEGEPEHERREQQLVRGEEPGFLGHGEIGAPNRGSVRRREWYPIGTVCRRTRG